MDNSEYEVSHVTEDFDQVVYVYLDWANELGITLSNEECWEIYEQQLLSNLS